MASMMDTHIREQEMNMIKPRRTSGDFGSGKNVIKLIECQQTLEAPQFDEKKSLQTPGILSPSNRKQSDQPKNSRQSSQSKARRTSIESISNCNKLYRKKKDFKRSLSIGQKISKDAKKYNSTTMGSMEEHFPRQKEKSQTLTDTNKTKIGQGKT
jgi:hypothetical protein